MSLENPLENIITPQSLGSGLEFSHALRVNNINFKMANSMFAVAGDGQTNRQQEQKVRSILYINFCYEKECFTRCFKGLS
jgi:hypothetical protein